MPWIWMAIMRVIAFTRILFHVKGAAVGDIFLGWLKEEPHGQGKVILFFFRKQAVTRSMAICVS